MKEEVGSSALHRPSSSDGVWIFSERTVKFRASLFQAVALQL